MPSLKYFDPATQSYKHVVGGMTQDSVLALTGRRNVIHNGDFRVAQRGDGPFTVSAYTLDNLTMEFNGGTSTLTRQLPVGSSPEARMVVTGQSLPAHFSMSWRGIEDVNTLNGQTVTLSFMARAASGNPKLGFGGSQYFGSGGSTQLQFAIGTVTLSTTMTRYFLTFTVPSISGKTVGANSSLWISIHYSAGATSTYASVAGGIGAQTGTFSVTDMQLEAGNVATPFERLPIAEQFMWCSRYFQRLGANNPNAPLPSGAAWYHFGTCRAQSATTGGTYIPLRQTMRVMPTITASAANTFNYTMIDGNYACTAITWYQNSCDLISTGDTVTSGLVRGDTYMMIANGSAIAWIDCSAEL